MTRLLGGQIGLDDFLFAHVKGDTKVVKVPERELRPTLVFLMHLGCLLLDCSRRPSARRSTRTALRSV